MAVLYGGKEISKDRRKSMGKKALDYDDEKTLTEMSSTHLPHILGSLSPSSTDKMTTMHRGISWSDLSLLKNLAFEFLVIFSNVIYFALPDQNANPHRGSS